MLALAEHEPSSTDSHARNRGQVYRDQLPALARAGGISNMTPGVALNEEPCGRLARSARPVIVTEVILRRLDHGTPVLLSPRTPTPPFRDAPAWSPSAAHPRLPGAVPLLKSGATRVVRCARESTQRGAASRRIGRTHAVPSAPSPRDAGGRHAPPLRAPA
jgi:hypothetical protein